MTNAAAHTDRRATGFVPSGAVTGRLIAVADATLDVDMDRPLAIVDAGRLIEFPAHELFENPPEARANWREMIAKVRDRSGVASDETKVTVLSIEHNGEALAERREDMATISIRVLSREGHITTVKQELGKPRETAAVARALKARGITLSAEALGRVGLAGVQAEPAVFYRALFGTSLGGGRNNVTSDLAALARAAFGPTAPSPVETVSPQDFTGTPYTRVALLSKYAPDGRRYKTILRTDQPADLTQAMDGRAAELCASGNGRFTDVLATGDVATPGGPYDLARRHRLAVHALVSKPSMAALTGVASAVFNSESGELGRFLTDIQSADREGTQGIRALKLFEALKRLEDRTAGLRAEIEGLTTLAEGERLADERRAFFRTLAQEARERLVRAEEDRSRVIKDSVGLIASAGERSAGPADILVTNGPTGAVGMAYAYDFQVIFRIDVLEDHVEAERTLVDRLEALSGGVISMRHRDTTGCGDSCMAAWMVARYAPWARMRERFYFREIGTTRIPPGDYKYACALAEAFWRAVFVKTLSGVMFRCMDANLARVPDAAVRAMLHFVNERASEFIRQDLPWLIDSGDSIDAMKPCSFGFWCYRTHKVANEKLPHSVDVIAQHLGVSVDERKVLERQLAHSTRTGTPLTPGDLESIRRAALAQDVEPAWRAAAQAADAVFGRRR